MFDIEDYNYDLPGELIAQDPKPSRDNSRLLYVDRKKKRFSDYHFHDLPGLLRPGDLLVVNNTKVVPARLLGHKESGGKIEILVLDHHEPDGLPSNTRWCLSRSSRRPKKGTRLLFTGDVTGIVKNIGEDGLLQVAFRGCDSLDGFLEEEGKIPLPPYIKREPDDGRSVLDRERYQTVYALEKGAVAAPTAGLHFSNRLIEKLKKSGVTFAAITLHVGPGTFRPVRVRDIRNHILGEEKYSITSQASDRINDSLRSGRRIISVGTTVVRALETAASPDGLVREGENTARLMITPGYRFRVIDGLITNFHLPKSSLLFLVSAFAGFRIIKDAYRQAIEKRYRFYSYGDAMLVI
jgi:S-adenosylmethionine:tRNA ribosyltransferase-isomerase